MGQTLIDAGAGLLCAGVDELLCGDLSGLDGAGVIGLVKAVEAQRHRLAAVDARLLYELGERALAGEIGTTGPADVLMSECRATPAEAKARVRAARDLGPRRSMVGEVLDPIYPEAAAALALGTLSPGQAKVICDTLPQINPDKAAAASPVLEAYLVQVAQHEDVNGVRDAAAKALARINPDGLEPAEDKAERLRDVTPHRRHDRQGRDLTGRLTEDTAALWDAIFDSLAAPQPSRDENGTIIGRDPRTAGQRRHDALREAALRLLRSGTLPDTGGMPATVLVQVNLTDLIPHHPENATTSTAHPMPGANADTAAGPDTAGHSGIAQTSHGGLISLRMLMHLACEANILPVILDNTGGVMAFGRDRRTASRGQRHALTARDGGCCYPGCTRPAAWTEVHHIHEWANQGRTDIDNLCLLCPHHHRSFERDGWIIEMSHGRPQWIPPPWLDPKRQPRHNTAHHLDDITFDVPDGLLSA